MSKLYFRYGAMNSGKSTAVIQVAYNYEERDMKVILLKPSADTKGDSSVVSRLGTIRDVDLLIYPNDDILKSINKLSSRQSIDCILVDEAQFLSSKQVNQLFDIAVNLNIPVICYGLRTDFQSNSFPGSSRLLEIAHSIEELKTICRCNKKAILNGRKLAGKFIASGHQLAIDGKEDISYESLCGSCYIKLVGPLS